MSDGKIYITISDERGQGGQGGNQVLSPDQNSKKNKKEKNPLGDYAKHQFFNLVKQQSTQAIQYTSGNIGNFTGNYIMQKNIDETMTGLGILRNIGLSAYAGFKASSGNPWGAIIGAAVSIIGTGVNAGLQYNTLLKETAKQNYNIEQLRKRSGLNGLYDGSRGTEN